MQTNKSVPPANGVTRVRLTPGQFYGGARLSHAAGGICVSHRIADRTPDEVLVHTHDDGHFVLVTSGRYVTTAAGGPAEGQARLIYNPPGTTHRDHFERGRGSFLAISLAPANVATATDGTAAAHGPLHLVHARHYGHVVRIARACAEDCGALAIEALCLELLSEVAGTPPPRPPAGRPPAWLNRALELLYDESSAALDMGAVAAAAGVHPVHLARTFRRYYRCTPGDLQRFRRLEIAAGLLAAAGTPLSEVALRAGFADQSHFSKAFRRSFGLPPGEFRRLTAH